MIANATPYETVILSVGLRVNLPAHRFELAHTREGSHSSSRVPGLEVIPVHLFFMSNITAGYRHNTLITDAWILNGILRGGVLS